MATTNDGRGDEIGSATYENTDCLTHGSLQSSGIYNVTNASDSTNEYDITYGCMKTMCNQLDDCTGFSLKNQVTYGDNTRMGFLNKLNDSEKESTLYDTFYKSDSDDENYNVSLYTVDDNIGGSEGAASTIESIGGTYLNYLADPVISPGCNLHIGLAPGSGCPDTWAREDSVAVMYGDCDVEDPTYTTLDVKDALALVENAGQDDNSENFTSGKNIIESFTTNSNSEQTETDEYLEKMLP